MPFTLVAALRPQDLPVCFPGRACMDFTPLGADAINLTSTLTPASQAIEIGYIVLLGLGIIAIAVGLLPRPHQHGPSPWFVAMTLALVIAGYAATSAVDSRFSALSLIFGPDPGAISPSSDPGQECDLPAAPRLCSGSLGSLQPA